MTTFTRYFGINKAQSELDFVDIFIDQDTPLYVDPYALTTRNDAWSQLCCDLVVSFFSAVMRAVHSKDRSAGIRLLSHLGEPEETNLGVSKGGNKGRGIGGIQASELFDALAASSATSGGLLEGLSDLALFIPGIARDKISDMTTNIIRRALIDYTKTQCDLLNIPTQSATSGMYWDLEKCIWKQEYVDLPICNNRKIILVPKYTVRYQVGADHSVYRSKFVLEFLQAEHLRADDGLVTVLKNKEGEITRKVVYKKDLDTHYPKEKSFLSEFSIEHPEVIERYRESLRNSASKIPDLGSGEISESQLATYLSQNLQEIPPGTKSANEYHSLIVGIVSFIYFPNLIYPRKEGKINGGRKRIDILYTNGKVDGLFYRIAQDQSIKATLIPVECKNYTEDIANPEFDQLLGRFDHTRGKFGMLFYRSAEDENSVLERCRDAAKSGLGIVLPINDSFVHSALASISDRRRDKLDRQINDLFQSVIS